MLKSIVVYIGVAMLIISCVAHYIVENGFITNPVVQDVPSGRMTPYKIKWKVVYISEDEQNEMVAIYAGEISGLVIVFGYAFLQKARKNALDSYY
jgi:hypothetical protein